MRTVILDDEHAIVALLARICTDEGCTVAAFTSPAEALIHLASEPVDLLITDLSMPGTDGLTVIREAWRLQPDLLTLVVTGHASAHPLEEVLTKGTVDVIFKPFHQRELRARLALIERRRALIEKLHARHRDLQAQSTEMIRGLQEELIEARGATVAPSLPDAD